MKGRIKRRYKIKQRKPLFKKPLFWVAILLLFFFGTITYFFAFFDKFQIKQIIVSGNEKTSREEIENIVWKEIKKKILFFDSQSIFLISPLKIKKSILDKFPLVEEVEVKRQLWDNLIINLTERQPFFVFCPQNSDCFFGDKKGIIFEPAKEPYSDFLIVRQDNEEIMVLGKEIFKKEIMDALSIIKDNFEENLKIKIEEIKIVSSERLNIKTKEGWEVYLNPVSTAEINFQIEKLNLLLEKEVPKETRTTLKYIDLRFTRAYICYKNSACADK